MQFASRYDGITGSAIRRIFSLLDDPDMISFAGGNPAPEMFPSKELAKISEELIAKRGGTVLQYGGTMGTHELTESVNGLLRGMGYDPQAGETIMLTGSSQGIELMTKAFIEKGDAILVENPSFLGALQTFRLYQAELYGVEMDDEGMMPEDLEKKLALYHPKFVYIIPTFQNPTGKTLSAARRKVILELCRKYDTLILEDDPYGELRFTGKAEPGIKSFDDERHTVVRLMSFSKTISPGLRVGAAYGHKDIIQKFNLGKQGMDVHTAILNQMMVSEYIDRGFYQPHVKEISAYYAKKANLMVDLAEKYFPKGSKIVRPDGGLFTWAELPEGMDVLELFPEAIKQKVAYVPGTHFYADGGHLNTVRLNFSMATEENIKIGMKALGKVFSENR